MDFFTTCGAKVERSSRKGKIGYLLEETTLSEFSTLLNNQATALNLLLTALSCRTTLEQHALLNKEQNRQVLRQVQDDRTSVLSLSHSASLRTLRTAGADNWSLDFDFHHEIITSNAYVSARRSNMRKVGIPSDGNVPVTYETLLDIAPELGKQSSDLTANKRSTLKQRLTRRLRISKVSPNAGQVDPRPLQPIPPKIFVFGSFSSGKSTIVRSLKWIGDGNWEEWERDIWKRIISSNTVWSMRDILKDMEERETPLDSDTSKRHVDIIWGYDRYMRGVLSEMVLPEIVSEAIQCLWQDSGVRTALDRLDGRLRCENAAYFFEDARRFADTKYTPTKVDILRSHVLTTGLSEWRILLKDIPLTVIKDSGHRQEREEWIHVFDGVDIVIFAVDIANYDLVLVENDTTNRMADDLSLFNSMVNSRWFVDTKFVLVFTKMDKLEKKLRKSPIENYVTGFEGNGRNIEVVKAYMENTFLALMKSKPREDVIVLYTSFVDGYEVSGKMVDDALTKQLASKLHIAGGLAT
ncbi:G-alpha-domain-containing protein [Mollisia scopiformis]|uniref:G-alpha-domain-containing protein n=1 Tax=Mollisia scopiformis TaxID=149040 RepID=A0A194WXQ1_MOLSC|nr:G-alpha-domain-containing protein [Mollisia scopiformis]KUJ12758.1 G-alpha-domain-containing protein [Mollisia scopiformis]